jgi:hypothetical protein
MGKEKKNVPLGGIRISENTAKEYKKALKHYGVSRPDFARKCIDLLIERYQAGDPMESVFAVPFPNEEAKNYKAALKHYHMTRRDFAAMCVASLIERYEAGEPITLPIVFRSSPKRR